MPESGSAVCTLFEGSYHFGVAALANSLYASGFRGTIYVGFRGALPPWVNAIPQGGEALVWAPAEGLTLRFIPLKTEIHLTNYKPRFLLDVWRDECPSAERMFYFDPDIVVLCRWGFFEEWLNAGVAVCEDVNGSMPSNHPIRHAWRTCLQPRGMCLSSTFERYFNGGFIGLERGHKSFLSTWQDMIDIIEQSGVGMDSLGVGDRTFPFTCRDQDALNIACMATDRPISPMGADGMDFQWGGGGYVMAHAVGRVKPWNDRYAWAALRGRRMSRATRSFLQNLYGPIRPYPTWKMWLKRWDSTIARIVGRIAC